jgi:hypothetical protein
LRAFDAVEHQGQCLWRLPFIVAQRDPALGHGIAAYKPIEVELLYNGVGLDVLGIGYERFPEGLRKKVVDQYPRVNFKQEIAISTFLTSFLCQDDFGVSGTEPRAGRGVQAGGRPVAKPSRNPAPNSLSDLVLV